LKRIKNGKASGQDELPAEIFKAAGNVGVSLLKTVINSAFREETIPSDWEKALICPIYKKKGSKQTVITTAV
jgi:hypothetical protein